MAPRLAHVRVQTHPLRRSARAAARPPYKHALVVAGVAIVMASLFVVSYTLALGRPKPRQIPTALIGSAAKHGDLIADIERFGGSSLEFSRYTSEAAARQ